MERIRLVWGQLGIVRRIVAVGVPLAIVIAVGGAAAAAIVLTTAPGPIAQVETASPSPTPLDPPLPPVETLAPDVSPPPTPVPTPPGADPLLGTDGRLTVLLLGSDYRPAHPGNRTDAIMVVSVDPTTGKAAGFSIPRDTSGFPLASGATYGPKVNGLYAHLQSQTGNGGLAMRKAVAKAFGIEVDGYVFIGFAGVKDFVAAVGGVDITLSHAYYDAEYWVNSHKQGWGLPAGKSHLGPADALIFARSRKGDNDFGRARRQQQLVLAAIQKARSRGIDKLPQMLRIAARTVRTDLPLDRADDLFDIVAKTDISKVKRTVFGPKTYASGGVGTSFQLRLGVCREWIKDNFPPIRPMGQWPAATAAPSTAPSAPAASPSP
jgi:polyisoprenyl-teichoic acid--peptidoglycan teichoic acid transferase